MKKKGFTLIELVVAIAILGIITIISIPAVKYIQNDNKDTKYEVYGKAINAAGKAYTDNYNEDLFGASNNGCAIIAYDDLKARGLIEDIQVRGADCNNPNTCVIVRKSKNGNYHYDTHVTCKNKGKLIYKTADNPCNKNTCILEENGQTSSAPRITLWDEGPYATKPYYKLFSSPRLKIKIEDLGVGLKANQILNYQWYLDDSILENDKGIIYFKNKNYAPSATKSIPLPAGIGTVTNKDATYTVKISGSVQDIDNNTESRGKVHTIKYHIETVKIKVNANGGYLANPHGNGYSLAANGDVVLNGSTTIHTILRNQKVDGDQLDGTLTNNGLVNWSSTTYLNLRKTGYTAKEWNTKADGTGTTYDQTTAYKASNFCSLSEGDCEVQLYAIWRINVCTVTYNPNGGSFGSHSDNTTAKFNYGNGTEDMPNASGGYFSATKGYYYPKPSNEWIKGSTTYNQANGYTATDFCPNLKDKDESVTLKVNWYYENCRSGYIINNQTITTDMLKKKQDSGILVKTYHWDYKSKSCNGDTKKRRYHFKEYACTCKIDKNTKKTCNNAVASDRTNYTHEEGQASIYYNNSDNGKKACKADLPVNSYVSHVCQDGQYASGQNSQHFHGYYFFKGAASSPYNAFSPSAHWYHSGANPNNVIDSSYSATTACIHACNMNY